MKRSSSAPASVSMVQATGFHHNLHVLGSKVRRHGQQVALCMAAAVTSAMTMPTPAAVQAADSQFGTSNVPATVAPAPEATGSDNDSQPPNLAAAASASSPAAAPLHGYAGVVGPVFAGGDLSCGGVYKPSEKVVFSATLPCGTTVRLYNPAEKLATNATVVNQKVMFKADDTSRVADISPAAAKEIGLDPDARQAAEIFVQPLAPGEEGVALSFPTEPEHLAAAKKADETSLLDLTRNLIAECGNCGDMGMLGVARVTVNRANSNYMGASSIHAVVYAPNQFSWVKQGKKPSPAHAAWSDAKQLAELTLNDRLSGPGLGLFYKLGKGADHFYCASVPVPAWAGGMRHIAFAGDFEKNKLHHRYYASTSTEIASR